MLGNQKAVILFQHTGADKGKAFLASFDTKSEISQIHAKLHEAGLDDHTLQPLPGGGTRVHIFSPDGSDDTLKRAQLVSENEHGTNQEIRHGRGEFIGAPWGEGETDEDQRRIARKVYSAIINTKSRSGEGFSDYPSVWRRIRTRYGHALTVPAAVMTNRRTGGPPSPFELGQAAARCLPQR